MDNVSSVAIDASDNLFVTGTTNAGSDAEVITSKWTSSFTNSWTTKYAHSGNDCSYGIVLDGSGNIFVAGYVYAASYQTDLALFKYNSSGVLQNAGAPFTYDGAQHLIDAALAITLKGSYVYLTGYTGLADGNGWTAGDVLTIKYDLSGTQQWAATYGRSTHWDAGICVLVDNSDNVYTGGLTGYKSDDGTGTIYTYDVVLLKYNSSGTQLSADVWDGPSGADGDSVSCMVAVNNGSNINLILTGFAGSYGVGSGPNTDALLLSYDMGTGSFSSMAAHQPISPEILGGVTPDSPTLSQNYPNPFNPSTTIQYHVDQDQSVSLKVYDVLGKEVATLVDNQVQSRGDHQVRFDASQIGSGVYFYQVRVGAKALPMKKMLMVK